MCGRVDAKRCKDIFFYTSGIGGMITVEEEITVPANDNVIKGG
jgi:hypothetical protein